MENLENQSSSTIWSYSCFWPTIIVELGILIKYCGSDFESDISFLSWLLSKLSESPIFLAMSGGKSKFERASLKPHSAEWWTAAHSLTDWQQRKRESNPPPQRCGKSLDPGPNPVGHEGGSLRQNFSFIDRSVGIQVFSTGYDLYTMIPYIICRVISRKIES